MNKRTVLEDRRWYRFFKVLLVSIGMLWFLFVGFGTYVSLPTKYYIHQATCSDPITAELRYPEEQKYSVYTFSERLEGSYQLSGKWYGRACASGELWSDYQFVRTERAKPIRGTVLIGVSAFLVGIGLLFLLRWVVLYVAYGKKQ